MEHRGIYLNCNSFALKAAGYYKQNNVNHILSKAEKPT